MESEENVGDKSPYTLVDSEQNVGNKSWYTLVDSEKMWEISHGMEISHGTHSLMMRGNICNQVKQVVFV